MTVRRWPRFASRLPRNQAAPPRLVLPAHPTRLVRLAPLVRPVLRLVFGKIRLALLEKSPHAFDAILGFERHLLRTAFRAQLFLQRIIECRGMQGANLPENRTGPRGKPMRHGLRACDKFT